MNGNYAVYDLMIKSNYRILSLQRNSPISNRNVDWIKADFTEVEIGDVGRAMLDLSNKIAIEQLNSDVEAIKAQLQTLVAQVAEKDAKIAELEKRPTIEQVRDARAGSVVLTVEPDGNNITLGLTIEQSDNLIEWKNLEGEITRTIPIPDGKKFYRFALDK